MDEVTQYKIIKGVVSPFLAKQFISRVEKLRANSVGYRPQIWHTDKLKTTVHYYVYNHLVSYAKDQDISVYDPTIETSHVLHYEADESIAWHVDYRGADAPLMPDGTPAPARKVSASLALNNSGHLFQIITRYGVKTWRQELGDLVLFPGWAAHRVGSPLEIGLPEPTNERWSFAMWLSGPDFV